MVPNRSIGMVACACLVALAANARAADAETFAGLDKAIAKSIRSASRRGLYFGTAAGVVTDNKDPDDADRVKVRFPWLPGDSAFGEAWARVQVPLTTPPSFFCLPEVGDEVLVAFAHGDMRQPVVIGSLWSGSPRVCAATP